jgi:hypothetical protein
MHVAERSKNKLQWAPGSYWYDAATNKNREIPNDYLTAMESIHAPMFAGISGTLDLILTMGMFFGLSSKHDLEKGRLACCGWMIDAKDHSLNEIMVSSKGFGLDYTPAPDSYRQTYLEENFIRDVENRQKTRGYPLPEACLSEEYSTQKARQLGMIK